LDREYPHWRLHRVDPGALKFAREHSGPAARAIARGDFNGDGVEDIGLLIGDGDRCRLIIAEGVRDTGAYRLLQFEEPGADFLLVSRKGAGAYDHNTGHGFVFPSDSVEVNWFEKAARAYVFKDGHYYVAQTSD